MNTHKHTLAAFSLLAATSSAWATDGYFPHGYGIKAKGMGGASLTATDTAFAGANNPAAAAWSGQRMEIGAEIFSPTRSVSRNGAGPIDASVKSGSPNFLVPELGYNQTLNEQMAVGVTVYGNGGMNTDYPGGQINCGAGAANVLCGNGRLGVDLMQLVVAPTLAYKVSPRHAFGISPLLVYQRFSAEGLQAFGPMSSAGNKLSNNGHDSSTGLGVRLGYLGQLNDQVSIGATYSPKTKMSRFKDYAGLFAGQGSFDIPENLGLGVNFAVTPAVSVALDYQKINYGKVPSIGNPSSNQAPLGSDGGPGFGWSNVNVVKLGVQWQYSPQLTLRAGYNHSSNPVSARDVSFNIVAPGVITRHYTLGATYKLSSTSELSAYLLHAPTNSVSGASMFGGSETIRMSQKALGLQYAWSF